VPAGSTTAWQPLTWDSSRDASILLLGRRHSCSYSGTRRRRYPPVDDKDKRSSGRHVYATGGDPEAAQRAASGGKRCGAHSLTLPASSRLIDVLTPCVRASTVTEVAKDCFASVSMLRSWPWSLCKGRLSCALRVMLFNRFFVIHRDVTAAVVLKLPSVRTQGECSSAIQTEQACWNSAAMIGPCSL
jgi:hypothetical protein